MPYKGYAQIPYLQFDGTSNSNSLQVSLQRRFSKGLTLGAVYTWSKALATANSDQDTQDTFSPLLDYRATSWDRAHVFAANYVYDIPSIAKHLDGPKWLAYITDHYQLGGVTQFMTGTPVDLNSSFSFPRECDRLGPIRRYCVLLQRRREWEPALPAWNSSALTESSLIELALSLPDRAPPPFRQISTDIHMRVLLQSP